MVADACAPIVPSEQFKTAPVMVQVPCEAVDEVHVNPPLVGSVSLSDTLVAALLPAIAGLLTTIVYVTASPILNVPPFGVLTTFNCAGGGVQVSEPESVAVSPPSAVTLAE